MANDTSWSSLWATGRDDRLPGLKLVWLGLLAGAISYLVLYFGGMAVKSLAQMRGVLPNIAWEHLEGFSRGAAITIGALTLAWRLIYRIEGQAHWGRALVVVGIVLFGFLVWPTPWTYRRFGCDVYQISRFMGARERVTTIPACEPAPADETPTASGS